MKQGTPFEAACVQVRAPAKQAVLDAREAACAAEEVQTLAATLVAKQSQSSPLRPQASRVCPTVFPACLQATSPCAWQLLVCISAWLLVAQYALRCAHSPAARSPAFCRADRLLLGCALCDMQSSCQRLPFSPSQHCSGQRLTCCVRVLQMQEIRSMADRLAKTAQSWNGTPRGGSPEHAARQPPSMYK